VLFALSVPSPTISQGDSALIRFGKDKQLVFDTLLAHLPNPLSPQELFPLICEDGYPFLESALRKMLRKLIDEPDSNVIKVGHGKYTVSPHLGHSQPSQSSQRDSSLVDKVNKVNIVNGFSPHHNAKQLPIYFGD